MARAFEDRHQAGRMLAERLEKYAGREDVIVLGLPRGGVPVASEIARHLRVPIDVFIVRKLGVPGFEELALGAIASGGVRVLNPEVTGVLPNAETIIEEATTRERLELERREQLYRGTRPPLELQDRTIILVDDGLATGATMRAAVGASRQQGVARIVVAVPVGPSETCDAVQKEVDEMVCPISAHSFHAVGQFYDNFSQITDEEVRELLREAEKSLPQ